MAASPWPALCAPLDTDRPKAPKEPTEGICFCTHLQCMSEPANVCQKAFCCLMTIMNFSPSGQGLSRPEGGKKGTDNFNVCCFFNITHFWSMSGRSFECVSHASRSKSFTRMQPGDTKSRAIPYLDHHDDQNDAIGGIISARLLAHSAQHLAFAWLCLQVLPERSPAADTSAHAQTLVRLTPSVCEHADGCKSAVTLSPQNFVGAQVGDSLLKRLQCEESFGALVRGEEEEGMRGAVPKERRNFRLTGGSGGGMRQLTHFIQYLPPCGGNNEIGGDLLVSWQSLHS